jgi:GGDEF domain-containing protein
MRRDSYFAQRTAKGVRYRGFHDGLTSLPNASAACGSACVPASASPRNGANAETLLMNAELAMYRAKQYDTGHGFAD